MIEIISGRPRGGKSLFCQQERIIAELVHGNRPVLTNLAVLPGELNAYLQEKFPGINVNLHERLFLLTDEQVAVFYRWWVKDGVLFELPVAADGRVSDWNPVHGAPCVHVIDELHYFFNAREWMKTGRDALTYLSMHGKLGCDVIGITQAVSNVDKQFRVLAQQYTYLRNLSYERLGIFRSANLFLMMQYLDEPKGMFSKPQLFKTFKLDPAVARTYETAKGVGGIAGLNADKDRRRKGLPLPILFGSIALLLVAILLGLHYAPRMLQRGFMSAVTGSSNLVSTNTFAPTNRATTVQERLSLSVPGPVIPPPPRGPVRSTNTFFVGLYRIAGETTLLLSDGRQFSTTDVQVYGYTESLAVINGAIYYTAKPAPAPATAPFKPASTVVRR